MFNINEITFKIVCPLIKRFCIDQIVQSNLKYWLKKMFKLNILFVVNLIIFVVYAEYQLPNPNEGECGKLPPSIPNRMRTLGGTMAKNGEYQIIKSFFRTSFNLKFIYVIGRFPWIVMIGYSFENSSENAKPVFQCGNNFKIPENSTESNS